MDFMKKIILTTVLACCLSSVAQGKHTHYSTTDKFLTFPSCTLGGFLTVGFGVVETVPVAGYISGIPADAIAGKEYDYWARSFFKNEESETGRRLLGSTLGGGISIVLDGIIMTFDGVPDGHISDGELDEFYDEPFINTQGAYIATAGIARKYFNEDSVCGRAFRAYWNWRAEKLQELNKWQKEILTEAAAAIATKAAENAQDSSHQN